MRTLFFIVCTGILALCFGQEADAKKKKSSAPDVCSADTTIHSVAAQMPLFQGKPYQSFVQWAAQKIEYPKTLSAEGLGGRVVVRFVIEKDGRINEVEVLESPYLLLSAEVLRVIGLSPKWRPGKNEQGEAVRMYIVVPFVFSISDPRKDHTLPPQLRQEMR